MKALIMMLLNTSTSQLHPIMYLESPLPGVYEEQKVLRFRSKGHHTSGIDTKEDALKEVESIATRLNEMHYTVCKEVECYLEWDGSSLPADVQIRNKENYN